MRGETAKMAAIKRLSDQPYRVETEMVDVTKVANFEKKVPADWITEDGMHVNEKFERYARPLIQAELSPIYINGVPFFAAVGAGVLDDPAGEGIPPCVYSADRRRAACPHAAAWVLRLPGKPVGIPPALRATSL